MVTEMYRGRWRLPGLGVELMREKHAARKVQAQLGRDPGKRHENGQERNRNPEAVMTPSRRKSSTNAAHSQDCECECQDDAKCR
jgi:hypothetical protein